MQGNRARGNFGERIAEEFLRGKGYRILERQWRCPLGEIDLVAEHGGTLIVVEVKTRRDTRFGPPELAIHPEKARRLARLAELYLQTSARPSRGLRVDVVAVELVAGGQARVRHHENALADLPFLDNRRRPW